MDMPGTDSTLPALGLRLCLVTPDVNGPIRNGGIGTACEAIAEVATGAGYKVTILYARGNYTETLPIPYWVQSYARRAIELVPCPESGTRIEQFEQVIWAWNVWRWLKTRSFDAIYAVEHTGVGFFVAMAKLCGLAFQETRLIVGTHSPTMWHLEGNRELPTGRDVLGVDYMERMTVAHADTVISPSRHMIEWMRRERWSLPEHVEVLANPVPFHARPNGALSDNVSGVKEFVFFGRLEPRKGIVVFARALSLLQADLVAGFTVTFLGKRSKLDVTHLAKNLLPKALSWRVIDDLGASDAVAYLKEPGRVAIVASLMENAPMTVVECLGQGIPFLASAVGGIPELLHPEDRERHLFLPEPWELARALSRTISEGLAPARPAVPPLSIDAIWRTALRAAGRQPEILPVECRAASLPLKPHAGVPEISVVLVHRNRPEMLRQALDGLKGQEFQNYEVILVDDGSTEPAAIRALKLLETEFHERGWRIIMQENKYLGAARNAGWRDARAEYILFHDDDNICMTHQLGMLLSVARRTNADILTSALAVFTGDDAPDPDWERTAECIWVPLGGCAPLGLFQNCFGDAHALVRRRLLGELGGFSEDFGIGHEDFELFARAALAGYRVLGVPEPLFWYRVAENSMLRSQIEPDADTLRSARPYLSLLDPPMRQVFLCAIAIDRSPELTRLIGLALTSVLQSRSIRISKGIRRLALGGRDSLSEAERLVTGDANRDFRKLQEIMGSMWWDLAAPMRLAARFFRKRSGNG
jgi:GT2 family glycosyltransferase/glycosyltransferase involved in cell wall biosynthesis